MWVRSDWWWVVGSDSECLVCCSHQSCSTRHWSQSAQWVLHHIIMKGKGSPGKNSKKSAPAKKEEKCICEICTCGWVCGSLLWWSDRYCRCCAPVDSYSSAGLPILFQQTLGSLHWPRHHTCDCYSSQEPPEADKYYISTKLVLAQPCQLFDDTMQFQQYEFISVWMKQETVPAMKAPHYKALLYYPSLLSY